MRRTVITCVAREIANFPVHLPGATSLLSECFSLVFESTWRSNRVAVPSSLSTFSPYRVAAAIRMPKVGLTKEQWRERVQAFAQRSFVFGQGQRPAKGSFWARQIAKVESCPRFLSKYSKDLFGRPIRCSCGYHDTKVSIKY
jgi:hypothetical protein